MKTPSLLLATLCALGLSTSWAFADNAVEKTTDGAGQFGFGLLSAVAQEQDGPLVAPPLSLIEAITFTANGAAGKTRSQLTSLFNGANIDTLNAGVAGIRQTLKGIAENNGAFQFNSANSIWGN